MIDVKSIKYIKVHSINLVTDENGTAESLNNIQLLDMHNFMKAESMTGTCFALGVQSERLNMDKKARK